MLRAATLTVPFLAAMLALSPAAPLTASAGDLYDQRYRSQAYDDHPLPIDYGQTISQPCIVALMTQEAAVRPGHRALE